MKSSWIIPSCRLILSYRLKYVSMYDPHSISWTFFSLWKFSLNIIYCMFSKWLGVFLNQIFTLSSNKIDEIIDRNSHRRCSVIKGVLRNFVKFTEKKLYQSLFFNEVTSLRPATLLKNRLWHRCFPVIFTKFLRTPILQNTSGGCFCIDQLYLWKSILYVSFGFISCQETYE